MHDVFLKYYEHGRLSQQVKNLVTAHFDLLTDFWPCWLILTTQPQRLV